MKLTLMIEGSASALATILASLPEDGVTVVQSIQPAPAPVAMPTPVPAAPAAIPPMPTNPTGGDEDGDDDGPVNAAAPATDKNGMPWDERIHASTKGTNADGSWRYRRGVPKEAIAAVEAELRAAGHGAPVAAAQAGAPAPVAMPMPAPVAMPMPAMPLPAADPAQPAPVAMPMPAPIPAAPAPLPAAAPIPVPDPAAMAYPAPAAAAASSPLAAAAPAIEAAAAGQPAPVGLDFAQFMQHLSGQMQKRDAAGAPLVHADYLAGITAEIGAAFQVQLNAITDIASDPNKINYAVQLMQRDGRW